MIRLKKIHIFWLVVVLVVWYAARPKTVKWEEEVPLNTGETIWVARTVTYSLKGDAGNPFDIQYRPDWDEEVVFKWRGRSYRYFGEAQLMLIAISPRTGEPALVAMAAGRSWSWKNNYRCTTPFYVQFNPMSSGQDWSWPPRIEPWLMNLPYNLMLHRERKMRDVKSRYTASDRNTLDRTVSIQSPYLVHVAPGFKTDSCIN